MEREQQGQGELSLQPRPSPGPRPQGTHASSWSLSMRRCQSRGSPCRSRGPPPPCGGRGPFPGSTTPKCGGGPGPGLSGHVAPGGRPGSAFLSTGWQASEQRLPTQQVLGVRAAAGESEGLRGHPNPIPGPPHSPLPLTFALIEARGGWQVLGLTLAVQRGQAGWGPGRGQGCQGNTATERGSTFVHTVGRSQLSGAAGEPGLDTST